MCDYAIFWCDKCHDTTKLEELFPFIDTEIQHNKTWVENGKRGTPTVSWYCDDCYYSLGRDVLVPPEKSIGYYRFMKWSFD